jgi:hypothetical protein
MMASGSAGNKKKRNRKRKNKEGKLTAEEIHNMPTEDLCNYIENKPNQGEPGPFIGQISSALGQKLKKRTQPMSIEDQENRQGKGVFNFNDMSRGAKHNFSG